MMYQERNDYSQYKRQHNSRKEKERLLMETKMKLRSEAEKYHGKRNRETEPNIEIKSKRTKLHTVTEYSKQLSKNELGGYRLQQIERFKSSEDNSNLSDSGANEIFSNDYIRYLTHKDKNEMTDQGRRVFNEYKRKLTDRNQDVTLKQVNRKKMKVEKVTDTSKISAEDIRQKRKQRILDDFRKDDEVYEEFSKVFEQIKKIPRTAKEELKYPLALPENVTDFSPNRYWRIIISFKQSKMMYKQRAWMFIR
ncbi:hypothetical protein ACOME3_005205 [Neoechinorhynchus agilis]